MFCVCLIIGYMIGCLNSQIYSKWSSWNAWSKNYQSLRAVCVLLLAALFPHLCVGSLTFLWMPMALIMWRVLSVYWVETIWGMHRYSGYSLFITKHCLCLLGFQSNDCCSHSEVWPTKKAYIAPQGCCCFSQKFSSHNICEQYVFWALLVWVSRY